MRSFTRRGLASFAVASVLIFAPLTSTIAFADDEPVVETPTVEVVDIPAVETPVVEVPDEAPAESASPAASPAAPEAADAGAQAAAPSEDAAPSASRMADAPMSLAASFDCDYTSYNNYGGYNNGSYYFPYCLDVAASTVHWNPTGMAYYFGYYVSLTDLTLGAGVFSTRTADTHVELSLVPGHTYSLYADDGWSVWGYIEFTAPSLVPAAPTDLAATRHATADTVDLSWTASAGQAFNPVVSYTVDVTSASSGLVLSTSVTTTAFSATGLVVGEDYTFTVTAVSTNGETSTAATTTATLEAIAPTAATNVILTRTDETLSAAWTAPTYDGGSGPVEYWIDIYADGDYLDSYWQTGTSLIFDETAEFSVMYTVYVTAYTDAGDAPTATSNSVTRADSAPGTPVAFTEAHGYKEPIVYVTWDLAATTGSDIESIGVTLYDAFGAVVRHEDLDPSHSGWNFLGLTNDTAYTVGVVVANAAGPSAESDRVPVTTLGLVPPSPTIEELAADINFAGVTVALTGTTLNAHINGLAAGTWVYGTAFSTPTGLGWTQVDAAGNASWSIAGAALPAGAHTLAVQHSFGGLLGAAGFNIAAAAVPAALAHAGTDPSGTTTLAIAMLALGVLVTASRLRRRARA